MAHVHKRSAYLLLSSGLCPHCKVLSEDTNHVLLCRAPSVRLERYQALINLENASPNPITTAPASSFSNASINSYKIQQPHRNSGSLEPLNTNTLIFGKPTDNKFSSAGMTPSAATSASTGDLALRTIAEVTWQHDKATAWTTKTIRGIHEYFTTLWTRLNTILTTKTASLRRIISTNAYNITTTQTKSNALSLTNNSSNDLWHKTSEWRRPPRSIVVEYGAYTSVLSLP